MSNTNELRVFISSTFRDLQEEREHLVRKIFPEIRSLCRSRGITFTEVDLRWGLTDEDVVLGQVVRTCLEEIDKCRPYFIGLVGERYGWAPPLLEYYKDPELFTRWPWLEDAAADESSITDIEFRHGALNDPSAAEHARFFVRRQRRSLGDASRATDRDEGTEKLEALKDRVRDAGLSVEEFRDPVSLGELIYDELIEIIERDFADAKPPTPLQEERSKHIAFAASRRRAYIPNPQYLTRLNAWVAAEEAQPLILYAESGSGKSSLVSFWCEQLRRRKPELHIIEHYVGIGAGDSDHLGIIKHVIEEIKEKFDRGEEIPSKPEQLEQAFANWLGFNVGAPMLLVIDGINQLSGRALDLHWLPPVMPEGVKLIISSTVEQTLVDLRARGWSELGMQPLNESEREAVVVRFLAEYGKALSTEQVTRIASDAKCSHPLFLRTLLEELRLHGMHEHLDRTLDALLSTTGTEDLFQKVLERLEDDYSQKAVREVLSLIWASRFGLSEEDLESLTGIGRMKLSSMLLGLDYHLVRRDGLLSFFHDYLNRAVEKRYLSSPELRLVRHQRLAEHFERAEVTLRTTLEMLHALTALGLRQRVEGVLSDVTRFELLWRTDRPEVLAQWSQNAPEIIALAYSTSVENWKRAASPSPERQTAVLEMVAGLQSAVGNYREADRVLRECLPLMQALGDREAEARLLSTLSWLARCVGRMDEANAFVRGSEAIARELGDRRRIGGAVTHRGVLHHIRGEYDEALACLLEAEAIARESGDQPGIAVALGNRGIVHHSLGEHIEALACYAESEQITRQLGNRQSIPSIVGNRGIVHAGLGEHAEALACYLEMERIARELGDRRNICAALNNRGNLHRDVGEYDEALACFGEMEHITRETGDLSTYLAAVGNRGSVHADRRDYAGALADLEKAIAGLRSVGNRRGVAQLLTTIADVLLVLVERASATVPIPNMPAVLAPYLHNGQPETWKTDALQVVHEKVRECMEISQELSNEETLYRSRVLMARVAVSEGNRAAGIEALDELLRSATDDEHRAELHYWMARAEGEGRRAEGEGQRAEVAAGHRAEALRLYEVLFEKTPKHEYRKRIDELRAATGTSPQTTEPTTPEATDATD